MDKPSGKCKGTAFVEFKSSADAKKAAAACDRGRQGVGPGITLQGRQIDVDMAVNPVCVCVCGRAMCGVLLGCCAIFI